MRIFAVTRQLAAILLLACLLSCSRQEPPSKGISKKPGEKIVMAWDFPKDDEQKINGFVLKQASAPNGPFHELIRVQRDHRSVEFPVEFQDKSNRVFYLVVALYGDRESPATNIVEIERQ